MRFKCFSRKLLRRIGNQVRILDGTAAVCAETKFNDDMSVTGKLGRQNLAADVKDHPMREPEDLLEERPFHELWE